MSEEHYGEEILKKAKNQGLDNIPVVDAPELVERLDQYMAAMRENVKKNVESAIKKERVEDLTDDEKFAMGYGAGVRIVNTIERDGKVVHKTEPFNIIKDGDEWIVMTENDGWKWKPNK